MRVRFVRPARYGRVLGLVFGMVFALMAGDRAWGQTVWYVDAAAPPGGGGTGWGDEFDTLDKGLAAAAPLDEVWVKAGVYQPSLLPSVNVPDTSARSFTFWFPAFVKVYGSFQGGEADPDQRIPPFDTTILSGEIAGTPTDITDDVYHVVTIGDLNATTSGQLLNGLVIEKGNSDNSSGTGGKAKRGGGIRAWNATGLMIEECILRDNIATKGGGLFVHGGDITMKFCRFDDNLCRQDGGGAMFEAVQSHMNGSGGSEVHNTIFTSNESDPPADFNLADGRGGAVFVDSDGGSGTLRFANCLLNSNRATRGGAVYLDGSGTQPNEIDTLWVNCTFAANRVWATCMISGGQTTCVFEGEGISFYVWNGGYPFQRQRIYNTISWINSGGLSKEAIVVDTNLNNPPLVEYSDIERDSGMPWPGLGTSMPIPSSRVQCWTTGSRWDLHVSMWATTRSCPRTGRTSTLTAPREPSRSPGA